MGLTCTHGACACKLRTLVLLIEGNGEVRRGDQAATEGLTPIYLEHMGCNRWQYAAAQLYS